MFALSNRTTLFLYLKEGTVGVFACRGPVALDACLTCVFFTFDKDHCTEVLGVVIGRKEGTGTERCI